MPERFRRFLLERRRNAGLFQWAFQLCSGHPVDIADRDGCVAALLALGALFGCPGRILSALVRWMIVPCRIGTPFGRIGALRLDVRRASHVHLTSCISRLTSSLSCFRLTCFVSGGPSFLVQVRSPLPAAQLCFALLCSITELCFVLQHCRASFCSSAELRFAAVLSFGLQQC